MSDLCAILALAGPQSGGEASPISSLVLMGLIFGIFYFILILPMRNKQRKLEDLVKALKTGDKVVINPGILGVIVRVEDDHFRVRVDEKNGTTIPVLKSAIRISGPLTRSRLAWTPVARRAISPASAASRLLTSYSTTTPFASGGAIDCRQRPSIDAKRNRSAS